VTKRHDHSDIMDTGTCTQRPFMYCEASITCVWSNHTLWHRTSETCHNF